MTYDPELEVALADWSEDYGDPLPEFKVGGIRTWNRYNPKSRQLEPFTAIVLAYDDEIDRILLEDEAKENDGL